MFTARHQGGALIGVAGLTFNISQILALLKVQHLKTLPNILFKIKRLAYLSTHAYHIILYCLLRWR